MTHACPCCVSKNTTRLLTTPPMPVNSCVLVKSLSESMSIPRRPIDLWWCKECDFLWNISFEADLVEYGQEYEGTQSFSKLFREYTVKLANGWINDLPSAPQTILEAGCGQGELLEMLSELTDARLIGFDPAFRLYETSYAQITATLLPLSGEAVADLVINRMTLEHVDNPIGFIETQKSWLAPNGHLISQIPNAERMLKEHLTCDLLYEHVNYFTKNSITALMETCGLASRRLDVDFEGQHLSMIAQRADGQPRTEQLYDRSNMQKFADSVTEFSKMWQSRLEAEKLAGNEIWIWGAGSRATAFMCNLSDPDLISGVVDINPNRDGTYILGTSLLTYTPEVLRNRSDISIIVMNPIYGDEIGHEITSLNTQANLIPL